MPAQVSICRLYYKHQKITILLCVSCSNIDNNSVLLSSKSNNIKQRHYVVVISSKTKIFYTANTQIFLLVINFFPSSLNTKTRHLNYRKQTTQRFQVLGLRFRLYPVFSARFFSQVPVAIPPSSSTFNRLSFSVKMAGEAERYDVVVVGSCMTDLVRLA